MKITYSAILLFLFLQLPLFSQTTIKGVVTDEDLTALVGANVQWKGTSQGTTTDIDGAFKLMPHPNQDTLLITYVGFQDQAIVLEKEQKDLFIQLKSSVALESFEVRDRSSDNRVSTLSTINVENIGKRELQKAACCNLAEAFETNAAVDISYSDAVTGAKEVKLLGLRGSYTQLLMEKRPIALGAGTPYIYDLYPGTWIEGIQVAKGAASIQSGNSGIAGQINNELAKPWQSDRLFLNLFGSTYGRMEANIHLNQPINDKWSTSLLLHGSGNKNNIDANSDGFLDTPRKEQWNGLYRLFYRGDNLVAQFNAQAIRYEINGGQFDPSLDNPYRIEQAFSRYDLFGKVGYTGFEAPNTSVALIANTTFHRSEDLFGLRSRNANQDYAYIQGLYATEFRRGNFVHGLNLGSSYTYSDLRDEFDGVDYGIKESIGGVYAEYNYFSMCSEKDQFKERFGISLGMRYDYHNVFGHQWSPRVNIKYNFDNKSVIRFIGGKGYRTPYLISENLGILANNGLIEVESDVTQEEAWNFGLNFTKEFTLGSSIISASLDLYRTNFQNKIVLDMEQGHNFFNFYNQKGKSFSNAALAILKIQPVERLEFRFAYKFNDMSIGFEGGNRVPPLFAK